MNADAILVFVTILAALGWIFSYHALEGLPPLLFMGIRFILAGGLLVVVGWKPLSQLSRHDLVKSCGMTGIAFGAALSLWIVGLHHAKSMGVGAFLTSLGVVFAPVVGWMMYRVHVTKATWIAVGIASVGMLCLSVEKGLAFSLSDLLFVACALAFSIHFNLVSRYAARIAALPLTAVQLNVAGVMSLAMSSVLETWPTSVGMNTIGWLLASVLIASSLRFFLQVKGQSMASVSHAALIMTLEPVWTALLAALWLGERMSGIQLLGCFLILLALLVNRVRWGFLR